MAFIMSSDLVAFHSLIPVSLGNVVHCFLRYLSIPDAGPTFENECLSVSVILVPTWLGMLAWEKPRKAQGQATIPYFLA